MEDLEGLLLKKCLDYCIENFNKEEAVKRIVTYIEDNLKLEREKAFGSGYKKGYANSKAEQLSNKRVR